MEVDERSVRVLTNVELEERISYLRQEHYFMDTGKKMAKWVAAYRVYLAEVIRRNR